MSKIIDRNLVSLVKKICLEDGIEVYSYSENWILELTKNNKRKYIIGYEFELNSAATNSILKDKAASGIILSAKNIPCVENKLFINSKSMDYIPENGNWGDMLEYAKELNFNMIIKPNSGTGGTDIYHVENLKELESTVHQLFRKYQNIIFSPYYDIENEFRAIVLDGEIVLMYKKENLFVIGNGNSTFLELIKSKYSKNDLDSLLQQMDHNNLLLLDTIIKKNIKINISWQFNLGKGSVPSADISSDEYIKVSELVLKVADILNIKFASIDIIKFDDKYLVLEANGGVMMEYYSRSSEEAYETAKNIYRKAIDKMFE